MSPPSLFASTRSAHSGPALISGRSWGEATSQVPVRSFAMGRYTFVATVFRQRRHRRARQVNDLRSIERAVRSEIPAKAIVLLGRIRKWSGYHVSRFCAKAARFILAAARGLAICRYQSTFPEAHWVEWKCGPQLSG